MSAPLISIIMPTYNVSRYIERCLFSCLEQQFKNYEIIVVDDCGSDNSILIAEKLAEKDKRIKIIKHTKNLGTFHARKTGVMEANGNFVLFLDPDDELEANALSTIDEILTSNDDLDVLLFNSTYVPGHKFYQSKPSVPVGLFENNIPKNILKHKKLTYGTLGKLYSLKALKQSYSQLSIPENVRLVYGEDALLFCSVISNSELVIGINDKLYLYYRNDTSITKVSDVKSIKNNIKQLDLVLKYIYKPESKIDIVNTKPIVNRLLTDKLSLSKSLAGNNKEYLEIMLSLLNKTKSWRVLVNILIFLASFTTVKR